MSKKATTSRMYNPAHPGEVLREYLPAGMTIAQVAQHLGVTRQALSALLNGRAGVSAEMALRLSQAFGTSAEMWVSMQATYDLWVVKQKPRLKVSRIAA
jgi:antitoxin HigA-1